MNDFAPPPPPFPGSAAPTATPPATTNGSSNTPAVPQQPAATAVVAPARPVLKGTIRHIDDSVTYIGQWAMTETDPITSQFKYTRTDGPESAAGIPAPFADAELHHLSGTYSGFFMLKVFQKPDVRVDEKEFRVAMFTRAGSGDCSVVGTGKNVYGAYDLDGSYNPSTDELKLFRSYRPRKSVATPKTTRKRAVDGGVGSAKRQKVSPASTASASKAPRARRARAAPVHARDAWAGGGARRAAAVQKHGGKILKTLLQHQWAWPFEKPVDPVALNLPTYFDIIKSPMDLGTCHAKLDRGQYDSLESFGDDVRLTFNNAKAFNAPESDVYVMANTLLNLFEEQFVKASAEFAKASKAAPKRSASPDGDSSAKHGGRGKAGTPGARGKGRSVPRTPTLGLDLGGAGLGGSSDVKALQQQIALLTQTVSALVSQQSGQGTPVAHIPVAPTYDVSLDSVPLTYEEKEKMSENINLLQEKDLQQVLGIIQERMPLSGDPSQDEIELDLDALDIPTLREIQRHLSACLEPKPKRPPTKRASSGSSGRRRSKPQYSEPDEDDDDDDDFTGGYRPRGGSRQRTKAAAAQAAPAPLPTSASASKAERVTAVIPDLDDDDDEDEGFTMASEPENTRLPHPDAAGDHTSSIDLGGGALSQSEPPPPPPPSLPFEVSNDDPPSPTPPPPAAPATVSVPETASISQSVATPSPSIRMDAWSAPVAETNSTSSAATLTAPPTTEGVDNAWQSAREQVETGAAWQAQAEAAKLQLVEARRQEAEQKHQEVLQQAQQQAAVAEAREDENEEEAARQRSLALQREESRRQREAERHGLYESDSSDDQDEDEDADEDGGGWNEM